MDDELDKLILEIFGFAERIEKDPVAIKATGSKNLIGFSYGTLMRQSDQRGVPSSEAKEIKRGKIMKHPEETLNEFGDRLHMKFQDDLKNLKGNQSYTPHSESVDDYLSMRAGRPYSHLEVRDPNSKMVTYYSHHLYPIYKS